VKVSDEQHARLLSACTVLSKARKVFYELHTEGVIAGNDNHIGDIGEYWVVRYYDRLGKDAQLAPKKNSDYDVRLNDGTRVAVRTLTPLAKNGRGLPVKPLDATKWTVLAAVKLDSNLGPEKLAVVTLSELLSQDVFTRNQNRMRRGEIKSYPAFRWWSFLDQHCVELDGLL